jgi:hypothetical protein
MNSNMKQRKYSWVTLYKNLYFLSDGCVFSARLYYGPIVFNFVMSVDPL